MIEDGRVSQDKQLATVSNEGLSEREKIEKICRCCT